MKLFRRLVALAGASALSLAALASPAFAQVPPTYTSPGGTTQMTPPAAIMGLDSITGAKCFVGGSSTCQLPGTSNGGGGSPFSLVGLANLNVTAASANIALPASSAGLWVINTGDQAAYYQLGVGAGVTATVSGSSFIGPKSCQYVAYGAVDHIAAITASGTTKLQAQSGTGAPLSCGGASGGGVTAFDPPEASGTITTGGTFQLLFAANAARPNCFVQNPTTASEPLLVHWTSTSATVNNSASLGPGSSFGCAGGGAVVTGAVSVEAATTGHVFIANGN